MSLRLIGITKRYGTQLALDRVSLDVQAGDIYGFIGHNGAGKTTAMRIALGLVRPHAGTVLVEGMDAAREPREARARMGGLIETPGLHGGWSGAKNLEELARLQGLSRADARREAGTWIERVGLARAGPKLVHAYSHGMRQRLGIAQALLGSPRILLLDEPTNGLDPEGIAEMRELLRALNREKGTTILVSSHQLHELAALCNRIGVLKGGRLVAESQTAALFGAGGRYRLETTDAAAARRVLASLGITAGADGASLVSAKPAAENTALVAAENTALALDLGSRTPSDVALALVHGGVPLRAFAPAPQSLEQIYLRFPADTARAVEAAAPPVVATPPRERLSPGDPVRRALAADVRRWNSSLTVPLLLLAPAVAGALAIARRAAQAAEDARAVGGNEVFSATDVNGFEAVGVALQAGLPVLVFVSLGLASQSIAAELARGTLRNSLLRPITRAQLVLGKLGALAAATLGSYALLAAAALGLAALAFGFGDVTEVLPNGARFTLLSAGELWPDLRLALLAPLVPLLAYAAIGFLAGSVARVGAAALALALGTGVVLDLARGFVRALGARSALPSDHLPSPLSDTSFVRFYVDVAQGVSNATFEHGVMSVWVPAAWGVAAAGIALLIVQRRDVP